jgi:hypothetical protein
MHVPAERLVRLSSLARHTWQAADVIHAGVKCVMRDEFKNNRTHALSAFRAGGHFSFLPIGNT